MGYPVTVGMATAGLVIARRVHRHRKPAGTVLRASSRAAAFALPASAITTAAPPASRLRTSSTQPATVRPDARATWPASAASRPIMRVNGHVGPQPDHHEQQRQGPQRPAQRLLGHVGADQQQPGEAEDQREQGAGGLVDVVELAARVVVHGAAQLVDVAGIETAHQRVGHGQAAGELGAAGPGSAGAGTRTGTGWPPRRRSG